MAELKDSEGNILVRSDHRIDVMAHDIRISDQMLYQMQMGDALLLTTDHRGELQMERIPHYRLYHRL